MKNNLELNKITEISLAIIIVTVLLFTLISLPHPATLTGHPWKVELLSSAFLLITSIVLLLKNSKAEKSPQINNLIYLINIPFLLFILWSGLSYFWAGSYRSVAHHTFSWIIYLSLFTFVFYYIRSAKSIRLLIYVFSGISLILFLLIISDYLVATHNFYFSISRIRIRYGKYAELALTIAPVMWALAFYTKKIKFRNVFLMLGICVWLTIMLSMSKGAFLAGMISFFLFFIGIFFFSKAKYRRKALTLAGIWFALTFGTQMFLSYSPQVYSTVDYISGKTDTSRDTSYMRVFTWKISSQMISENFIKGVGADNFGLEINNSRKNYARLNPNDSLNTTAEDYYIERSHNEFIQIFAELGIVGFLLFLSIFLTLFYRISKSFLANRNQFSPLFWGSIAGITGFFISSLVSSFSFRAIQNGIILFMVLALLCYELSKSKTEKNNSQKDLKFNFLSLQKPVFTSLTIIFLLATANFLTQSISFFNVLYAEREKDLAIAEQYYENAVFFNEENGSAYLSKAAKLYSEKLYKEAALMFREAIDKGVNDTVSYYYLASSQVLSGNKTSAEQTLLEATEIFPRSIYVRTHYATLLKQNGKIAEAEKQFEYAKNIDFRKANSWKLIFETDVLTVTLKAQKDKDYVTPNDLGSEDIENVVLAIFFDNKLDKPNPYKQ